MNDLDELLREDARTWQTPRVAGPDLDTALARASARRSKLGTAAALVVVVALAAGGTIAVNRLAPVIPATPDPRETPSLPLPAPTPTAAPTADPLAALTDAVHDQAVRFGVPAQADAVRTTWLQAQEFLPASGDEPTAGPPGDTAVWVAQVRGEFSCDDCQPTQQGPEGTVDTLALVLTADGFQRIWFELGEVTRPLERLGQVVGLDPDGSTGVLSFTRAVHARAAEFGIPVSGEAVLTTWLKAQEFLPAAGGGTAGDTEVWVVQLRGEFSCDDCQPTRSGPEAGVSVLTLVLDAHSFASYHAEPGDVTRPLDQLGVVQAVDLELVA